MEKIMANYSAGSIAGLYQETGYKVEKYIYQSKGSYRLERLIGKFSPRYRVYFWKKTGGKWLWGIKGHKGTTKYLY